MNINFLYTENQSSAWWWFACTGWEGQKMSCSTGSLPSKATSFGLLGKHMCKCRIHTHRPMV